MIAAVLSACIVTLILSHYVILYHQFILKLSLLNYYVATLLLYTVRPMQLINMLITMNVRVKKKLLRFYIKQTCSSRTDHLLSINSKPTIIKNTSKILSNYKWSNSKKFYFILCLKMLLLVANYKDWGSNFSSVVMYHCYFSR